MSDDLYERDILTWSEHQAELLRRLARGQRVNGIDWEHVIEGVEDVGLSELNAVQSYLGQMVVHLLKLAGCADNPAARHWREEIAAFQVDAIRRFVPSMRQRIDLDRLYALALRQLRVSDYGRPPPQWPSACPFDSEMLLNDEVAELEARAAAAL